MARIEEKVLRHHSPGYIANIVNAQGERVGREVLSGNYAEAEARVAEIAREYDDSHTVVFLRVYAQGERLEYGY